MTSEFCCDVSEHTGDTQPSKGAETSSGPVHRRPPSPPPRARRTGGDTTPVWDPGPFPPPRGTPDDVVSVLSFSVVSGRSTTVSAIPGPAGHLHNPTPGRLNDRLPGVPTSEEPDSVTLLPQLEETLSFSHVGPRRTLSSRDFTHNKKVGGETTLQRTRDILSLVLKFSIGLRGQSVASHSKFTTTGICLTVPRRREPTPVLRCRGPPSPRQSQ